MAIKSIIKREYQSPTNPKVKQVLYLKKVKGGERVSGEWTENKKEAQVFETKSHAESIKKLFGWGKNPKLTVLEK